MDRIEIPQRIKNKINLVLNGKKRKKPQKKVVQYPQQELIRKASENLDLLYKISNTEPIKSFLISDKRHIVILNEFDPKPIFNDHPVFKPQGDLILAAVENITGVYYWIDADYPANRSNKDYRLVTTNDLVKGWKLESLKRLALLNEKNIWKLVEKWTDLYLHK